MPIHLPPISRRQFISRAAAAGAALVCAPHLLAASKKSDPNLWALFSDVHIAGDHELKVRGVNMTQHFIQAREALLALPKAPVGLFINGDCAYNSGLPEDYANLAEMLMPIRTSQIPVHLSVGNHDDRDQFWKAFVEEQKLAHPVPQRHSSLLETPLANFFILDSLEKTLQTPGILGPEQLAWLTATLDANPKKPAIVMVHHNPGLEGGNMGLKDTLSFLEIIRPRKQVKAYIFGHTHTWHVEQDASGIHFINLPAVSYAFKEGEPTGWVLASLDKKGMNLQLQCTDTSQKQHGQSVDLNWRA